ncbi:MAG: aspartate--tRNA(Asn) ligase [Thaumarchaeota archaeon]|nr:aspartate--tRNA(Asn) ligase [Candidatus Calditenuaceae archaeon]MDW8187633.1 aspartate--tRNA(Asn) ligase [Nitrososphaerota archaeon]
MKRTHEIAEIPEEPGANVRIAGFVENIKEVGRLLFVWVRDRTGTAQLTLKKTEADEELLKVVRSLNTHDVVSVVGVVPDRREAKVGMELVPKEIEVLSRAERLPIDVTGIAATQLDTRLDWRAIDLRNPKNLAVFRIQNTLIKGMTEWLDSHGFMQVFTPCIIGAPSESGAEMFEIDYFGKKAYLRQDPQLHRQLLMVAGFDRIYEIGPSWRAEPSHTPRHLCEHRGCAVELSYISDELDVMRVEEQLFVAGLKRVVEERNREIEILGIELEEPNLPIPELRFPEIYEILSSMGKEVKFGEDVDREGERLLSQYVLEKYNSEAFFINRFPFAVKPFYVMRVDDDPIWARSVDLIYRGLELSSGGQREHRYEKIMEQVRLKGMNPETVKWFTEFFRYGAPPHGGFNIGIERLTMAVVGASNIREVVPFPRAPERYMP